MIIVIEGPDNAGKTTLALHLAKKLRASFTKVERPEKGPDLLAYQNLLGVASQYSGVVITDRHPAVSEPIYGTIIRGGHQLSPKDIELCFNRIDLFIYCRPPNAVIMQTLTDRAQMEGVVENATRIIDTYDSYFESVYEEREKPVWTFNFQIDQPDELVERIKMHIAEYHS